MRVDDTLARILLVASDQAYEAEIAKNTVLAPSPEPEPDPRAYPPNTMPEVWASLSSSPHGQLADWKAFDRFDDPDTGFGATIYFRDREDGKTRDYIVAFQGTRGPDAQDWKGNSLYGWDKWTAPTSEEAARLKLSLAVLTNADESAWTGKIHFTGQSLGGALAEYAAYEFVSSRDRLGSAFDRSRVTLTTFSGLGGLQGLRENQPGFNERLLAGVATMHFHIENDLVHKLGGGHLNGDVGHYVLDARRIDERTGKLAYYDFWELFASHRIETGFYNVFNSGYIGPKGPGGLSFSDARRTVIDPLRIANLTRVGSAFANLFEDDVSSDRIESALRIVVTLLHGASAGPKEELQELIEAVHFHGTRNGPTGDLKLDLLHATLLGPHGATLAKAIAESPAGIVARYGGLIVATFASEEQIRNVRNWLVAHGAADDVLAMNTLADAEELVLQNRGPIQMLGATLVAGAILGTALPSLQQVVARVGAEIVLDALKRPGDWIANLLSVLQEQGGLALNALVDVAADLFKLFAGAADSVSRLGGEFGSFLDQQLTQASHAMRGLVDGAANTLGDLRRKFSDAIEWVGAGAREELDALLSRARQAGWSGAGGSMGGHGANGEWTDPMDLLTDALDDARQAAQVVVIRAGAQSTPYRDGIDPESLPTAIDGVAERAGRVYTAYLPYMAGPGGQYIALRLEGVDADKFTVLSANSTQPITGGLFYLLVPEGARQVAFTLWNDEDVDTSQTLTLHAQLVDSGGTPTHAPHEEAQIAFTAVDEQPFTIPGLVAIDPNPENPEIHGSDADEQILGKNTADIVYPYMGADLVRTGNGDDSVVVHAATGDDTAGDWIDLGEGNDFAIRWAGEDTLIGGPGADVILAGAGADTLYAEAEIVLADAIALGETQSAGGTGDLLDGWSGNDVAIGWSAADGLLGGDGEDVLVGMGGDDTIFGDWQFSQYTMASAEWRIERSVEWPTPERRKFNAKLVSVLTTEDDVAGGADTIFGGAGVDWLLGQGGDDFIDAGRDDDVIFGGAGADALYGRDGADWLAGDEPDDGTPDGLAGALHGADTLDGGAGDDEMSGNGGDDQLYGGDGDDSIGGDDTLTPGEFHGKDYLAGGAGNDKLWGEGNDDWLVGGDGDDHLEGDDSTLEARFHGADYLDGGAGTDELIGQGGDDELYGGDGDDSMAGDNADDEAIETAFHGDDLLDGGAGNDSLRGGGGKDRLFGGAGQDSILGDGGDVEGDDELHGGADGDTLAGNGGADRLYGDAGQDFLDGGAGDDLLQGGADLDRLEGGDGDDVYVLYAGDSPVGGMLESIADTGGRDAIRLVGASVDGVRQNGDTPDLVLSFGGDNEILIEGGFTGSIEGYDLGEGMVLTWQELLGRYLEETQNGSSGDAGAMLAGGSANDAITATGGGATLSGGRGDDLLTGSGGNNTYLYHLGDGTDTIEDAGNQPAGPNRVLFGAGITPDDLRLSTGSLRIDIGWDPRDRIVIPAFDPDDVLAQRAIDLFEFADGTTLTYEALIARGFDIDGTGAAETLRGTNLVDRIYGAAGDDFLDAGAGDDVLDGGLGNDTLTGGGGNDVYLFGYGDGQDTLADGGSGDSDALALFAGVGQQDLELERLVDDLAIKLRGALDQVLVRGQFAGDGVDRVEFADGSFWDRVEIAARVPNRLSEGPDTYTGSAYADTIYGRGGADRLFGQAGDDLIDGGEGADELYGGDGDDRLLGQADADWLYGGNGADALDGGAAADALSGEAGDDVLAGGSGDDTLIGGTGNDTYRFAPGDGRDTVDNLDASNGVDVLAFWSSGSTEVALRRDWSVFQSNDDLYVDLLDPAGRPTGEWVKLLMPFVADPSRLVDRVAFADGVVWTTADILARMTAATPGPDTFRGFAGADTLDGGAGNDEIGGADGDDVIFGGEGADRLWGERGADVLDGGPGDDVLNGDYTYQNYGTSGEGDVLRGGEGADQLNGDGGADVLEGGPGPDRVFGGDGDDLYFYSRGDGSDYIEDKPFYSNMLGGNDTLRFAAGILPAQVEAYRLSGAGVFSPGDDLALVIDGSTD